MPNRFYITTPIYYPNGEPHVGHIYTTLCADTIARYHRLCGDKTFFLTGTDEHGLKMAKTAAEKGLEPRALADRNAAAFKAAFAELGVQNDDFIRTTEPRHTRRVQEIIRRMQKNDDIYLGSYEGWYDEGMEEFVTPTQAKERDFKAFNGKPLVRYQEPCYFFRLSKYTARVRNHIEQNPEFLQPLSRRNEVLSKLKDDVADLSISRTSLKWGIPMPDDPAHVVYVWLDALGNYLTALGWPPLNDQTESGGGDQSRFDHFWPADLHLIGKEILWFHAVYWPAMLMSLNLELPRKLFAHGWWTFEDRKMSKSEGNFVDLAAIRAINAHYQSNDPLRFYLLRAGPFGNDLRWSRDDLDKSYAELQNVLGNLLNRVVKMVGRYRQGKLPALSPEHAGDYPHLRERRLELPKHLHEAYRRLELHEAVALPIELARQANAFIDETAPFKLAKDPAQAKRLDTVLHLAAQHIYAALVALLPVMPQKAREGLAQLGINPTGKSIDDLLNADLAPGQPFAEGTPLFPKLDEK
jgi:methionyl-tRNA synthetase